MWILHRPNEPSAVKPAHIIGGMLAACILAACGDPEEDPEQLWPVAGELFYWQLGLGGWATGESAIIVGPDGTIVLVDTGNDSHNDDVEDALGALIRHMNDSGEFPTRSELSVDHVVLTHFHADHVDGFEDLLEDVAVRDRVFYRGMVDLTEAANLDSAVKVCEALERDALIEIALCEGDRAAPCDRGDWVGTYPSRACPGLMAGNLLAEGDSGPAYLELGQDARLAFLAVDGEMAQERYQDLVGPIDDEDSNGENARSLLSLLTHGPFSMLLAADLTGGGSDTDGLEGFYLDRLTQVSDVGALGVDVLRAGHHGRDTSSSAPWVEALLPDDGRSRNAVLSISPAHAGSPHEVVLRRLASDDRLDQGRIWTTDVAPGGERHVALVDAEGGSIFLRTEDGGQSYQVQALGSDGKVWLTRTYTTVRSY